MYDLCWVIADARPNLRKHQQPDVLSHSGYGAGEGSGARTPMRSCFLAGGVPHARHPRSTLQSGAPGTADGEA